MPDSDRNPAALVLTASAGVVATLRYLVLGTPSTNAPTMSRTALLLRLLTGSVGLAAFAVLLRRAISPYPLFPPRRGRRSRRKGAYVKDLASVGALVGGTGVSGVVSEGKDAEAEYDVVIVGGGTSGCVLAARLSEDPNLRVLLLEAGGSGKAILFSRIPSGFSRLFHSEHDYALHTTAQKHAGDKTKFWPRGKMLGGCSSINAQMAQYGAPEDFDEWAKTIGDDSWSWVNLKRYFRKFEAFIPPSEESANPNPTPEKPYTNPKSYKGAAGPMCIGFFNNVSKASFAFVKSCVAAGMPWTPDFTGDAGTLGASRVMTYIDRTGTRVSAETAYLTDTVLDRTNLTVAVHAQVTRILFDQQSEGSNLHEGTAEAAGAGKPEPRAVGVEFAATRDGPRFKAYARKEVVIAAGAVHSPHVLLLSGIGPAAHLATHNIPAIVDLPGVGSNLVDHPIVDFYFRDKYNASVRFMKPSTFAESVQAMAALVRYKLIGTGPLVTNFGESAAFVRSDDPVVFPKEDFAEVLEDSTSGPGAPDLELFCTPLAYKEHGAVSFDIHTFALHVYLVRPTSLGEIRLLSNDAWQNPSIDPNYLATRADVAKLVRGARLCLRLAHTEPLSGRLEHSETRGDLDHALHKASDEELERVIRERVETVYHPACSARMAPKEQGGVVDTQLKVYGVKGLRVCDASVFPFVVSGHTAGACLAIAEKLADEMKAEFRAAAV
ncbi:hypothetical protein HGRIS_004448 [Hohenbuehelia grisea]|uniref:Glucose-methanol-choline oxidoreductase N-terminal domain-containing protein n=1 Tax=Hohenbuehelia grisea TaxID=104357 RepID=A0ABR3JBZ1_9AGAR